MLVIRFRLYQSRAYLYIDPCISVNTKYTDKCREIDIKEL